MELRCQFAAFLGMSASQNFCGSLLTSDSCVTAVNKEIHILLASCSAEPTYLLLGGWVNGILEGYALCLWSLCWLSVINRQSDSVLKVICGFFFLFFFSLNPLRVWYRKKIFSSRLSSVVRKASLNLVKDVFFSLVKTCIFSFGFKLLFSYAVSSHTVYS